MKPAPFRFGLVVLAAGASSRMGEPKQLLPVAGKPLLLRTIDAALESEAWPVVVVLGAQSAAIRPLLARHPVLVAENPAWAEGMASSLRAGIDVLRQFSRALDAAVVTLCDQPNFSAETVSRLIARQRESACSIVAARYNDRNGAPALFLREHFPTLSALTGEQGARTLLNGVDDGRIATVDLPELAVDLDTPEDYAPFRP